MTENAIVSILASRDGVVSLEKLRRELSHVAYISLRYHLARLCERGMVEQIGESYRLGPTVPAPIDA